MIYAIPYYPSEAADEVSAAMLRSTIQTTVALGQGCIHVFLSPEVELSLPGDIVVHRVPMLGEPESALPTGWLSSVTNLKDTESGCVFVLDFRNPLLSTDAIRRAGKKLVDSGASVLLSLVEAKDHPSQFNEYWDVSESLAMIPVSGNNQDVAGEVSQILKSAELPFVSDPFPLFWEELVPLNRRLPKLYELSVSIGSSCLQEVGFGNAFKGEDLRRRVFLYRESSNSARQVAFTSVSPAALPMFMPLSLAPVCLLDNGRNWQGYVAPDIVPPFIFSVYFFMESGDRKPFEETFGFLGKDDLDNYELIDGVPFHGCVDVSRQRQSPFVLNILVPSILPNADIELPYQPPNSPWKIDPVSLARINRQSGEIILGRQDFPPMFVSDGAILGFSGSVLSEPLQALTESNSIVPFFLTGNEENGPT